MPWPPALQRLRPDLLVTHYAESGATTYDVTDQWLAHVRPMGNADALVILGGVNDAANLWNMSVTFSRLSAIYEDAQSLGMDVYAITVIPGGGTYRAFVDELNRYILASDATVIDLVSTFEWHSELYMDSVHPNVMGQQVVAEAVAEAVR
jgi:lysophospholipase L1-like esterase